MEKKFAQEGRAGLHVQFTHESNVIVPGTTHRLGAADATEIWYKSDNVNEEPSRNFPGPTLIGDDPDRFKAAKNMSER